MEQVWNWRKGMFDSNYQVFEENTLKFALNFNTWSNAATVTTQNALFFFKSHGLSHPETLIYNSNQEVLGKITYNLLSFNAQIEFQSGDRFMWSFQNNWLSAWSLNDGKDKQALFRSATGTGTIRAGFEDELTIACGIFIREYYSRILFLLLIILFVPMLGKGLF